MQTVKPAKLPLNIQILTYAYVAHKYAGHRFEHIEICQACGSEYQVKIRETEDGVTSVCQNCGKLSMPNRKVA